MYRGQTVAVVMPIHNEQDYIGLAVSRVPDFVDLIIAVDDGSADATWERLCAIRDKRLVRMRHSSNRGVGAATRTGYKVALAARAELIAVMDGDGQMDGRDLPALLDCAIGGADYVKGNRFLHKETIDRMPRGRFIGNVVFSWLTRHASSFEQSLDAQCGYTVIRSDSLRKLDLDCLYDRYGFLNEMFFAARLAGLKVRSIPVRAVYGSELSGINPLTAVPTILYLIGRSYLRKRRSGSRAEPVFGIRQAESESAR